MKRPTVTNDVELAKAHAEMADLAKCGCGERNCRCPLPTQYGYHREAVEDYTRATSRAVMAKLRAYRDTPEYKDPREILEDLVTIIGWSKP